MSFSFGTVSPLLFIDGIGPDSKGMRSSDSVLPILNCNTDSRENSLHSTKYEEVTSYCAINIFCLGLFCSKIC
jgi:hypothetical protein